MAHAQSHTSAFSRAAAFFTGNRFLLLFCFLLSILILYPYTDHPGFRYYAFRVLTSLVIGMSVYAVSFRRSMVLFALLLAAPAVVQRVMFQRVEASAVSIVNTSLSFGFDVYVVIVILRHVIKRENTDSESVFGALCGYLLIGFSFARLYEMVSAVQRNAFYMDPRTNLHTVPDRFDCVYYSFGSMTAMGASGITPVSNQARSLSIIEALLGILYLAVLISTLMASYRDRRKA